MGGLPGGGCGRPARLTHGRRPADPKGLEGQLLTRGEPAARRVGSIRAQPSWQASISREGPFRAKPDKNLSNSSFLTDPSWTQFLPAASETGIHRRSRSATGCDNVVILALAIPLLPACQKGV